MRFATFNSIKFLVEIEQHSFSVKKEEVAAKITDIDFNASKLRIIFRIVYWKAPCDQLQQHNPKIVHIAFSCQLGCLEVPAIQVQ